MYSKEHRDYLKKIKTNKIFVVTIQILIIVLFLIIWQLLANFKIINTFITSSPINIFKTIMSLYNHHNLFNNIFVTIYETIISFTLCSFIGLAIASILWWNKTLYKISDPYLTILNSLPKVALGPIIIIWVGANMNSIILMALLISLIVTILNIYQCFNETDKLKIKLLESLGATKKQIYFKLIIPANISNLISTLKINISMSLIGVIMGEFLVSKNGIGYLIMYGSQVFNLDLVIAGIFILCVVAAIMYYIIYYIEKRLTK